ncbi:MAG: Hsp20/alpha crystallin family protein [Lactobacillus sp.]|jgi:HSP20 family protein|nr:Hsp20/alpha crystallin family protein [Lactobacillus sp.]
MANNNLPNRPNGFFDDFFGDGFFAPDRRGGRFPRIMKTDISQTDKDYTLKVDLPGFDKKNIHLNYDNGILTVSAQRDEFNDHENQAGELLMQERTTGRVSRSYRVPNVAVDQVKAAYDNGILTVTLPKQSGGNHNEISID